MDMNFIVDQEKCTNCKKCVTDCPVLIINAKTEYPTIKEGKEENCLECQHCLAVCPEGAISIWGKKPSDSILVEAPKPSFEELGNLMKTRRSVRRYKKESVDKSLISKLMNAALYAPTAKNENTVQFSVVESKEEMDKVRALTYEAILKANNEGRVSPSFAFLNNFQGVWETKKIDVIFRNAPHMVVASAPKGNTAPAIDCSIALSYFELLASSEGLGTLWDGFAKNVFEDVAPELKAKFGIPDDHTVVSVMIFGWPGVKHYRSIQNETDNIKSIKL